MKHEGLNERTGTTGISNIIPAGENANVPSPENALPPIHDGEYNLPIVVKILVRKAPTSANERRYRLRYFHSGKRWEVYADIHGNALANRKAAERIAAVIETEIEAGTHNPFRFQPESKQRWRFDFIIAKWLSGFERQVAQGQRSSGTLRSYRTYVNHYLIPHFKDQDVTEIKKHHITALIDAFPQLKRKVIELEIERGRRRNKTIIEADLEIAPKTQKTILLVLATFFHHCVGEEILVRVPPMPVIKVPRCAPRWTDQETQYKVLEFVPEKHKDFVEFNIRHGFRQGEACDLRLKDLVMVGMPAIRLHHKKTNITHYVPMHPKSVDMVFKKCAGKLPNAHVFGYVDNNGVPRYYTVGRLFRITKAALIKTGLELTPYEFFKHSKLTQAAQNGATTDEITSYAGWTTKAMADVYVNNDVRNLAKIHVGEVVELRVRGAGLGLEKKG